jgi:putative ABC transport system permease protein
MLINYFKIALRSLLKFKGYASINLIGLALGLTAGILIMLYVLDELSYDTFHTRRRMGGL